MIMATKLLAKETPSRRRGAGVMALIVFWIQAGSDKEPRDLVLLSGLIRGSYLGYRSPDHCNYVK